MSYDFPCLCTPPNKHTNKQANKQHVIAAKCFFFFCAGVLFEPQEAMMSGDLADGGLTVMPYLLLRVRRSNIVEDSLHVRIWIQSLFFACVFA